MEKEMGYAEVDIYLGASSVRTCLGDKAATLAAMGSGRDGFVRSDAFAMNAGISEVVMIPGYTRFESLLVEQLRNVVDASGIDFSQSDTQLIISTTKGNVDLLAQDCENIPDGAFLALSAQKIADSFKCANKPVIISNACISGVSAFVVAKWMLDSGQCRHAVVSGCDALCEFITSGFASFKSISATCCRPYDADRDGLTLGEAAGAVLLTVDRAVADEACIRLAGGCVSNDANHISGPSRTGDGLYYAIEGAMAEAGISREDVGFVNTHGTATLYNDEMESKAVAWAELDDKPLNSLKGYIGHTLGASGVVETVICAEQLKMGHIFGTKGYAQPGTPHQLLLSADKQPFAKRCCVKTASGFGGCNAAIVLDMEGGRERSSSVGATASVAACAEIAAEYSLPGSELPFPEFVRHEFKSLGESNMKFYKMSDMCKALYVSAEHLLENGGFGDVEPRRRAIVLANRSASLDSDAIHQQILNKHLPEGASPAVFVYTLANVAAGEMCIRHKIQGDNTFFIEEEDSRLAERYAGSLIMQGRADAVICGWCEFLQGKWNINIKLLKKR